MPPPTSVLVLEDDPLVARSFSRQLRALGLTHRIVQSAQDLAEDGSTYLVAIVDIHLPDGNGIELFKKLRKQSRVEFGLIFSATLDPEEQDYAMQHAPFLHKSAGVEAAIRRAIELLEDAQAPKSETRSSSSKLPCAPDYRATAAQAGKDKS